MASQDWIMDDTIPHNSHGCSEWFSENPVMMGFVLSTDILWAANQYVHTCFLFAHCVCLPWSGSCMCVFVCICMCAFFSPCHVVGVRWQFPCLAVTEECILLQSVLAAGCFGAVLCSGSGIITLPVIKPNPAMSDPQHCTFEVKKATFSRTETLLGELRSNGRSMQGLFEEKTRFWFCDHCHVSLSCLRTNIWIWLCRCTQTQTRKTYTLKKTHCDIQ